MIMHLDIRGFPLSFKYADVKHLIRHTANVYNFNLELLRTDEFQKKSVRVILPDELDAKMIMEKLNGLRLSSTTLTVHAVTKNPSIPINAPQAAPRKVPPPIHVPVDHRLENLDRELDLLKKKRELLEEKVHLEQHLQHYPTKPLNPWAATTPINPWAAQGPQQHVDNFNNGSVPYSKSYKTQNIPQGGPSGYAMGPPQKRPFPNQHFGETNAKRFKGPGFTKSQYNLNNQTPPFVAKTIKSNFAEQKQVCKKDGFPKSNKFRQTPPELVPPKFTLKPDKEIPLDVAARLNFAVGALAKELRSRHLNDEITKMLDEKEGVKKIKGRLRARLMVALAYKEISNYNDIKDAYYKLHPYISDFDIIKDIDEKEPEKVQSSMKIEPAEQVADVTEDSKATKDFKEILKDRLSRLLKIIADRPVPEEKYLLELVKALNKVEEGSNSEKALNESKAKLELHKHLTRKLVDQYLPEVLPEFVNQIESMLMQKNLWDQGNTLYSVIVRGFPVLPQKALVRSFIYKFNPFSILAKKKALLVKLANKNDYDRFLEANGTRLGDKYLNIQPDFEQSTIDLTSQIPNLELVNSVPETTPKEKENSEAITEKTDVCFDTSIDTQLDDLLASIKQEEELNNDNDAQIDSTPESKSTGEEIDKELESNKLTDNENKNKSGDKNDIEIKTEKNEQDEALTDVNTVNNNDNKAIVVNTDSNIHVPKDITNGKEVTLENDTQINANKIDGTTIISASN